MSTVKLGSRSKKLFAFLKKEGVLESFVTQCSDIRTLIDRIDSGKAPAWMEIDGGFAWLESAEGDSFWCEIHDKWVQVL